MIRNRTQLRQTRDEIARLRERIRGLGVKRVSRKLRGLQAVSLQKMLRELQFQVRAYEEAQRGQVSPTVLKRLLTPERPRIGEAIFLLRVAQGMTQAGLARREAFDLLEESWKRLMQGKGGKGS